MRCRQALSHGEMCVVASMDRLQAAEPCQRLAHVTTPRGQQLAPEKSSSLASKASISFLSTVGPSRRTWCVMFHTPARGSGVGWGRVKSGSFHISNARSSLTKFRHVNPSYEIQEHVLLQLCPDDRQKRPKPKALAAAAGGPTEAAATGGPAASYPARFRPARPSAAACRPSGGPGTRWPPEPGRGPRRAAQAHMRKPAGVRSAW